MILKYRNIKTLIALLLIAILSFTIVIQVPPASALTNDQEKACDDRWQGTEIKDEAQREKFNASNCAKSGYCVIKSFRQVEDDGTRSVVQRGACGDAKGNPEGSSVTTASPKDCSDVETSVLDCDDNGGNPIISLLLQVINFLAVGVGIAVIGGIIWGGMLYASSNGDGGKTKQGITTIVNSVIGLLLFIFMYAFINYLVPGGLFN